MTKFSKTALGMGVASIAIIVMGLGTAHARSQFAQETHSYNVRGVSLDGMIARVRVETHDGSGPVTVRFEGGDLGLDDYVLEDHEDALFIHGRQSLSRTQCQSRNNQVRVGPRGHLRPIEDYPTIVISGPNTIGLEIEDAILFGDIGDIGAMALEISHCGDITAGNVSDSVAIDVRGSGDLKMGNVGASAAIDIRGSGDIEMGSIGEIAVIEVRGSGDIIAGDVGQQLMIEIPGSGDMRFGAVHNARIDVRGSGDIVMDRLDGSLDVDIAGSGDVMIREGEVSPMSVEINGSGDVDFRGTARDVRVRENGSGDVSIARTEGDVSWTRHGRPVRR
ncbi:GIN domain-containing protein [Woodsholea maritima]|uniref:GIN domain-containing protein n=1 Tax=Woodsholea maritima TaxID=240237 RepID=UPI000367B1F0|nr:DUF2807 domain-containing protein [Woodsholea maritima]